MRSLLKSLFRTIGWRHIFSLFWYSLIWSQCLSIFFNVHVLLLWWGPSRFLSRLRSHHFMHEVHLRLLLFLLLCCFKRYGFFNKRMGTWFLYSLQISFHLVQLSCLFCHSLCKFLSFYMFFRYLFGFIHLLDSFSLIIISLHDAIICLRLSLTSFWEGNWLFNFTQQRDFW